MAWAAGGGTDLSLYDKFLKEWYMPKWIDLLNNLTTTYKLFRKRIVQFRGRQMVIALRTATTGAVAPVAPSSLGGALSGATPTSGAPLMPIPGNQSVVNALVKPKLSMLAIGVPQDVIDSSMGDRAAFYEVVDFEMVGAKTEGARYEDRAAYCGNSYPVGTQGSGYFVEGGLADIVAIAQTATTTTMTVSNINRFYKNQRIAVYATAGTDTYLAQGTITSIDRGARQIVLNFGTGTATVANTAVIYQAGSRFQPSGAADLLYGLETWGLESIVSDRNPGLKDLDGNTKYLGIDRTKDRAGNAVANGNPDWESTLVDAGGTLTYEKMQQVCDEVHDNSGGDPSVILTNRRTRRKYAIKAAYGAATETGLTQTRFNDSVTYRGALVTQNEDMHGTEGSDWMMWDDRIPLVVDRFASHYTDSAGTTNIGKMYFLDARHIYYALVNDWQWWAPEGRILREAPASGGQATFGVVAHAYRFGELVCDAPNTCGLLYGITT